MSTDQPSIAIIGIGDDGLGAVPESARQLILSAEILAGSERTLALVPEATGEHLTVGGDLQEVVEKINAAGNAKVAVLVIGDPLFYGLARFLCDQLGHDRCEIVPHVSSMQLAFARVKESWDEAYLTNLANHSLDAVIQTDSYGQQSRAFYHRREWSCRCGSGPFGAPYRLLYRVCLRKLGCP